MRTVIFAPVPALQCDAVARNVLRARGGPTDAERADAAGRLAAALGEG